MREGKLPTHLVENCIPLQRNLYPRTWSLNLRIVDHRICARRLYDQYVDGGLGVAWTAFLWLDGKKSCACLRSCDRRNGQRRRRGGQLNMANLTLIISLQRNSRLH